ncbi:MAG: NAD-dependent DNA ligase LigA, partial [Clostridiales bacterium]|nr:NAD-dependent DNA ligase LigA [Candidatus Blautia equi]
LSNAKLICRYFQDDLDKMMAASGEEISSIDGIGPVIARSMTEYFSKEENRTQLAQLLGHLEIEKEERTANQALEGKTFVITGSVEKFANRNELKNYIESQGGKVAGSVSKNTDYLINNDTTSNSAKNKKARELGIPVLSEDDFLQLAGASSEN